MGHRVNPVTPHTQKKEGGEWWAFRTKTKANWSPRAKRAKIKSKCKKSQIPAKSLNPSDLCIFTLHFLAFLFHGHCMWAVSDLRLQSFSPLVPTSPLCAAMCFIFFSILRMRAGSWNFMDSEEQSGRSRAGRLCDFYSLPTAPQGVTALCCTRISICLFPIEVVPNFILFNHFKLNLIYAFFEIYCFNILLAQLQFKIQFLICLILNSRDSIH